MTTERKLSVILAEDNPGDVFLVRRALDAQNLNYDLVLARDGEQAIHLLNEAAAGQRTIDLLLVDLNLPRHDGAEVLRSMRQHENMKDIPVIVLTSSDSPLDHERCMQLGAAKYFHKPSNLAEYMQLGIIAKGLAEAAG
jgi:CheY-like chemotaxis protein